MSTNLKDAWPLYTISDTLQTKIMVEGCKFWGDLNQSVSFCFSRTELTGKVRSVELGPDKASAVVQLKKDLYLLLMVETTKTHGILFDGAKAALPFGSDLGSYQDVLAKASKHMVASIKYSNSNQKWSFA